MELKELISGNVEIFGRKVPKIFVGVALGLVVFLVYLSTRKEDKKAANTYGASTSDKVSEANEIKESFKTEPLPEIDFSGNDKEDNNLISFPELPKIDAIQPSSASGLDMGGLAAPIASLGGFSALSEPLQPLSEPLTSVPEPTNVIRNVFSNSRQNSATNQVHGRSQRQVANSSSRASGQSARRGVTTTRQPTRTQPVRRVATPRTPARTPTRTPAIRGTQGGTRTQPVQRLPTRTQPVNRVPVRTQPVRRLAIQTQPVNRVPVPNTPSYNPFSGGSPFAAFSFNPNQVRTPARRPIRTRLPIRRQPRGR